MRLVQHGERMSKLLSSSLFSVVVRAGFLLVPTAAVTSVLFSENIPMCATGGPGEGFCTYPDGLLAGAPGASLIATISEVIVAAAVAVLIVGYSIWATRDARPGATSEPRSTVTEQDRQADRLESLLDEIDQDSTRSHRVLAEELARRHVVAERK